MAGKELKRERGGGEWGECIGEGVRVEWRGNEKNTDIPRCTI